MEHRSIANELITRGWTQGRAYDEETGAVCLAGALGLAFGGWEPSRDYIAAFVSAPIEAREALAKAVGGDPNEWGLTRVRRFNDEQGRTYDEVLRVAKRADEILEAQS